ncbi:MAG TPA: PHB depolymerase family esterase [Sphingobium sp.]|nr:PHB depolymerase family esterase [Sphingobium sp.]
MTDLFRTALKAARLLRRRKPLSAALALQELLTPSPAKPRKKKAARKGATSKRASSTPKRPAPGSISSGEFSCAHGSLTYRLYTPTGSARRRMPLIVMLHGCSQTADDFATGTRMSRIADEQGFLVLYPQQSAAANVARCWNWHDPRNQSRGKGEPAVIAALTRHAITLGRANPARVYIAGISAGGAAAAIIGAAYPDIYVAVGVHSAVARGDIRSLGSALAAMRGKGGPAPAAKLPRQLPTIVFHGDKDRIVHASNARGFLANLERSSAGPLVTRSQRGRSERGREYTRRIYQDRSGATLLEDWTVHDSGHSWSGGSAAVSHTDPTGPDASREMVRFFLARRRAG